MAKRAKKADAAKVDEYRHQQAKRKNNPPAKIAAEGRVPVIPKAQYAYSPRRPPVLRSDPAAEFDRLRAVLEQSTRRTLTADEAEQIFTALAAQTGDEPWLEWAGKRELTCFEVDPIALHIHERVSTQAILKVAARQDVQRSLFADPEQEYHEAVQFYRHDIDWTNRLILGDSLLVMSSLARREDLAGKVQMIYLDPPYGIKFASNFQPEIGRRDVKDKETDLTREPEMVKAFRDTWHLGVHSYLAYLRDRLIVARELLADSGSIFVQISDEHLHRVRCLLDEVFGERHFVAQISFAKTSGATSENLASTMDFLLWYARNKQNVKYHQQFDAKTSETEMDGPYSWLEDATGERRRMTRTENRGRGSIESARVFRLDNLQSQSIGRQKGEGAACWFPVEVDGRDWRPGPQSRWKTNQEGIRRLKEAGRLAATTGGAYYVRYLEDFPVKTVSNSWSDTVIAGFASSKVYVVETSQKVIQRCLLMTTDPGDLVLDPTCGSGTTAYVAEQWGRRWITIDTTRVAVAIARQRLLTAKYDLYRVRCGAGVPPADVRRGSPDPAETPTGLPVGEEGSQLGGGSARAPTTPTGLPVGEEGSQLRGAAAHSAQPSSPSGKPDGVGVRAAAAPVSAQPSSPSGEPDGVGERGEATPRSPQSRSPSGKPDGVHLGVDPHPGFVYKTVPHITLKSIAQNTNLDPIFAKHEPVLDERLAACNKALAKVSAAVRDALLAKLAAKQRAEGLRAVTDADRRRWLLPSPIGRGAGGEGGGAVAGKGKRSGKPSAASPHPYPLPEGEGTGRPHPNPLPEGEGTGLPHPDGEGTGGWEHWQVPFDTDPDWPKPLVEAVTAYRAAWRAKMDEVNACIAANADQEELVDQPEVVRGVVRVSGPFTVEAVQPPELSLGDAALVATEDGGLFGGEPDALCETFMAVRPVQAFTEAQNVAAYLDQMVRLLRQDGVRFPDNRQMRFSRLEPLFDAGTSTALHAEGRWVPEGQDDPDPDGPARVAVVFGPQYGPISAMQVVEVIRTTFRRGYEDLLFAGFSFDAMAQHEIDENPNPRLRVHMSHIRPDVNPGMAGLLKEQPGSQLFTVFGQPRTRLDGPDQRGEYTVTMEGVDIYNPVDNSIMPCRADKVAAWFLDSDYDGWTFCITQAFFPDRAAWEKLAKALGGVIDADRFAALSGTVSLAFPPGKHRCVAVKVIDPRGNEVMRVHRIT